MNPNSWSPVLVFAAFSLLTASVMLLFYHLLFFRKSMRDASAVWWERASVVFPFRSGFKLFYLLIAVLPAVPSFYFPAESRFPAAVVGVIGGAAAFLVINRWHWRYWCEFTGETAAYGEFLHSTFAFVLILIPHAVVAFGLSYAAASFDSVAGALGCLAIGLIIMAASVMGGFLKLGLLLKFCRPASPRLEALCRDMAGKTGISYAGIYELRLLHANAFVFPLPRLVGVTTRALASLSDADLTAILAHEWGHLKESRAGAWRRYLPTLLIVALPFLSILGNRLFPAAGMAPYAILSAGLALIYLSILRSAKFSRGKETSADAHAAAVTSPAVFACALENLHRVNLMPMTTSNRVRSHPDLYDRLADMGVPPSFPRPRPKSRLPTTAIAVAIFYAWFVLLYRSAGFLNDAHAASLREKDSRRVRFSIALTGGRWPEDYETMGFLSYWEGREDEAVRYYRLASAVAPEWEMYAIKLANFLIGLGDCGQAQEQLAEGMRRIKAYHPAYYRERRQEWDALAVSGTQGRCTGEPVSREWILGVLAEGTVLESEFPPPESSRHF